MALKPSAKRTMTRFADKGEDSKVVKSLIERRLREAIVCYQVGDRSNPASVPNIVDRRTDIATASDMPSNHSSRSNVFQIVFGTTAYRSVSQAIVRYTLEASGGNPLQHGHHSTCSRLNRSPHWLSTSWTPSWRGWIGSGVTHGKSSDTSGGQSCSSKAAGTNPDRRRS